MSLALFQSLCVAVLACAYALDVRARDNRRQRLAVIGALALSAWLGEHTVIEAYRYYHYADGWWLRVGHVPLLVPLIWPLVVLSARDVGATLWPGGTRWARAARLGAIVVFDAAIIEVCAVAAGFWSWAEGGYLGIPLAGLLGWGCFAFAASFWLDRVEKGGAAWVFAIAPAVLVAATHALILASWWGVFRWGPRRDLGPGAVAGFAVVAAGYAWAVLLARRRGRMLSPTVTLARFLATSVFVALLVTLRVVHTPWLWAHFGLTAVPYLFASMPQLGRGGGRAGPGRSSAGAPVPGS